MTLRWFNSKTFVTLVVMCLLSTVILQTWSQTSEQPRSMNSSADIDPALPETNNDMRTEPEKFGTDMDFGQAMLTLVSGDYSQKKHAVERLAEIGDERALPVLEAMADRESGSIQVDEQHQRLIFVDSPSQGRDAITGATIDLKGLSLSVT